jgi:peptide chain release factor 2
MAAWPEEQVKQDRKIALHQLLSTGQWSLARARIDIARRSRRQPGAVHWDAQDIRKLLSGENDSNSAIVTIRPGTGGPEGQDLTEILLRMYVRWAERHGMETVVTNLPGNEDKHGVVPPLKSATFEVNGENAYGFLRGEAGKHRMVRVPPYDVNARRHASFAWVFVYPQIDDKLPVDIRAEDLRLILPHGENDPARSLHVTHIPTGIVVQCQSERNFYRSVDRALRQLRALLHEMDKERSGGGTVEQVIRTYVFSPYRLITDHLTGLRMSEVDRVLDGDLDELIHAHLVFGKTDKAPFDG